MDFDAIIIGTGFGATVAARELAPRLNKLLMLERGVWWFSPERPMPDFLVQNSQGPKSAQPVQYWPRPDHGQGLAYFLSVVRTNNPLLEAGRNFADFFSGKNLPQPLYRYNIFDDINIITASGVGGGSLIYSNVTIEPYLPPGAQQYPVMDGWSLPLAPADYQKARKWMELNRGKMSQIVTKIPVPPALLQQLVALDPKDQANQYLDYLLLRKSRALRYAAQQIRGDPNSKWQKKIIHDWAPLELAVVDYDGNPPAGPGQPLNAAKAGTFCERQGRCFLGCLPGARHTLNKTLLDQFFKKDANPLFGKLELRSLTEVTSIRQNPAGGYTVIYKDLRDDSEHSVSAPRVILAAGCLGSTELLLRCQDAGTLNVSDTLGTRFSSNGDFAGFVLVPRKFTNPVYPIFPTRGPINTSHVMFQDSKVYINIEDSAVPPMFASLARAAVEVLDKGVKDPFINSMNMAGVWLTGKLPDLTPFLPKVPNPSNPNEFQTEHEIAADLFFFNCMGTDGARGVFRLDREGNLDLTFQGGKLAQDPVFAKIDELLRAMAEKMGGDYVSFPLWEGFADRKVLTVHPLGGCPMGKTSDDGVVNTKGQVFNTKSGANTVYDGLYVADASVIPGPLAVNPTLTIVAYALKIAAGIP